MDIIMMHVALKCAAIDLDCITLIFLFVSDFVFMFVFVFGRDLIWIVRSH